MKYLARPKSASDQCHDLADQAYTRAKRKNGKKGNYQIENAESETETET